jgi:hypothetical protein
MNTKGNIMNFFLLRGVYIIYTKNKGLEYFIGMLIFQQIATIELFHTFSFLMLTLK